MSVYQQPTFLRSYSSMWCRQVGLVFLSCIFSIAAFGQEQWEKEGAGEIKDVEIEIVKDRKIVLPRANRPFEKISPRPFEPILPAITYEYTNFRFVTPDYKPVVRPLKLKQEDLSKIYGNYVSAGAGNYGSFFLEGSLTTKRDKNKFMGAHLVTRSFGSGPVAGKNSASSATQFQLFGKSIGKAITFSGDAGIENRGTYFYGYTPAVEVDRNLIRQTYTQYSANIGIENTQTGDFNYSLSEGVSYLQDHYQSNETEISTHFSSTYTINSESKFLLSADDFVISRNDSSATNRGTRHLLRIKPSYQFNPIEKMVVTAGVNLAIQNDKYAGAKDFHLYPHLKVQYELSPSMEVYGVVTGDIDKVNLHTLSAENLWLDASIPITNTNRALEFRGGLTGKLGRNVSVGAGVSVASMKNYYFYQTVRDNLNPSGFPVGVVFDKFTTVYDRNTQRINPFAELTYEHGESFRVLLRGDYYSYDTDVLLGAWHRPTYRINTSARYNLYEKISLEASFVAQGGMKTLDPVTATILSLDPAMDLNFKARYFFSKQFSAFAQFNNVLSNNYPLYQSYSVRGFQVLAGVSWSF